MAAYAYLCISPNTYQDDTWFSTQNPQVFHYIKIGHTAAVNSGRVGVYNTYNPSIYTRMMQFDHPLDVTTRNTEINNRNRENLPYNIPQVGNGSSLALFLQRYCLEGSFQKGGTANEWFIVPNDMQRVVALMHKLDQDADSETAPRRFSSEEEFCIIFLKIMFG